MKITIMLSLVLVSLTASTVLINELRIESQRFVATACKASPYACYRPAVSFASLR